MGAKITTLGKNIHESKKILSFDRLPLINLLRESRREWADGRRRPFFFFFFFFF